MSKNRDITLPRGNYLTTRKTLKKNARTHTHKGKVSFCLSKHYGMKIYEWRYSSKHSNFGTRWRGVVSFMSRSLDTQGKSHWNQLGRSQGEHQSLSECYREKSLVSVGN
jgi:hypothetical protein